MKRSMRIWFTIATIIVVGCTSGNEDNDNDSRQLTGGNGTQGNGGSGGDDTGTVTGAGTTSVDPSGVVGGRTSPVSTCGDGIVDQKEDCDDGQNGDDEDGCTDICTFTCSNDADCSTNDMCAGEGSCDLTTHTCQPGIPLADGEKCGLGMACIKGICTNINCESSEDCISDCDPLASCNPATGVCEPGSPIADDTLCDNGDGYCKGSVCVSNTCGDGIAEPNEECDLGDENGTADSGCTERCTLFVCGNGVREGNEQCDDANLNSFIA
jgi:cysteine-rich repeat protein